MSLIVTVPASSTDLTTLATVKSFLGITGSTDDTVLSLLIKSASEAIVDFTNRFFAKETVVEKIPGSNSSILLLERTPIVSVSEVKFDGSVMTLSDYSIDNAVAGFLYRDLSAFHKSGLLKGNIVADPSPDRSRPIWQVTYVGGYGLPSFGSPTAPLLPSSIEQVAINTVVSLFRSKDRDGLIKSEKIADVYSVSFGNTSGKAQSLIPEAALTSLEKWVRVK